MPWLSLALLAGVCAAAYLWCHDADRRRREDEDDDLLRYMRERDEDEEATETHPWSFKRMKKDGKK